MLFREKMIFLMDITHTSNKVLAKAINVDPSMISLIRTGRRGRPRNDEHLRAMAAYFASRITMLYKKETLSDILSRFDVIYNPSSHMLPETFLHWFLAAEEEDSEIDRRVRALMADLVTPLSNMTSAGTVSDFNAHFSTVNLYYENAEKFEAIRQIYKHCLTLEQPATIYVSTDEGTDWFMNTEGGRKLLLEWKEQLIKQGFRFVQILPALSSPLFYDTLVLWLPLYATGAVDVYYYPRFRDNVYRRSMLIVPDQIALAIISVTGQKDPAYAMVNNDPRFIDANMDIFESYRKLCQKTLVMYRDSSAIQRCLSRFHTGTAPLITKNISLSAASMPIDTMRQIDGNQVHLPFSLEEYTDFMIRYQESVNRQRQDYTTIELCELAPAELVAAGKVRLLLPGLDSRQPLYYTVEGYILHLQNIIRLLMTEPYYFFVGLPYLLDSRDSILIKHGFQGLLVHFDSGTTLFEITQPDVLSPFEQYLIDMAERTDFRNKSKMILRLQKLIDALELYR